MKDYIPVIFAAVLLIIALVLVVAGINNIDGLPVLSADSYAFSYLSEGNYSAGVFAVGVFSIGIFSIGIFSIGIFNIGIFAIGIYAIGKYANKLVSSGEEDKAK
jgi:quaternary ammonium compound-resistance protein SugE